MIVVYYSPHTLYMFEMRRAFTVYCETVGSRVILYKYVDTTELVADNYNYCQCQFAFSYCQNATRSNWITILN